MVSQSAKSLHMLDFRIVQTPLQEYNTRFTNAGRPGLGRSSLRALTKLSPNSYTNALHRSSRADQFQIGRLINAPT